MEAIFQQIDIKHNNFDTSNSRNKYKFLFLKTKKNNSSKTIQMQFDNCNRNYGKKLIALNFVN